MRQTTVKCVDVIDNSIDIDKTWDNAKLMNEVKLISTGLSLMKIVRKIDGSFGGIILNTYINCVFLSISTLYVSSSILFYKDQEGTEAMIFSTCGCISIFLLCVLRLLYLTSSGQQLATTMKACSHALDKTKIETTKEQHSNDLKLLKKDLNHYCHCPINPQSAFSLSNSTLIGTFATIITYLVVLIQFKSAENKDQPLCRNETLSEMIS